MPKKAPSNEARAFGERLVEIMRDRFPQRRGAGAWLARKYHVATVTANSWLNGEYKPETELARRIAEDHGTTFDYLYFGRKAEKSRVAEPPPPYGANSDLANHVQQLTLAMTAVCDWIRETRPVEAPLLSETLARMARLDGSPLDRSPIGVMVMALNGERPKAAGNEATGSKKRTSERYRRP